jgi:microsomal dipeptidase-like Zn-dependent dipeptidase
MIADLHCHFPMHLVEDEKAHPHFLARDWWHHVEDELAAGAFDVLAGFVNHRDFGSGWRVSLDGLEEGGAGIVCSVLYWPFSEFELKRRGAPPDVDAFADLMAQLDDVEAKLKQADPDGARHVIVTRASDLDDPRTRFVHCVEGGFHLGPDPDDVGDQIAELARRGVFYITLAHLFFRGVAADAPAIPTLTDEQYNDLFPQPRDGLPYLGRTAIEAMWERRVVVDLSHMRRDVVTDALLELDRLDPGRTLPVIASHVGAESAGPPHHSYNLAPEAMRAVAGRDGVIGLITAQHLMGDTSSADESRAVLRRHIEAIHDAVGSHAHTAIGTDLDGYIRPTLDGLESASDLTQLEEWIRSSVVADDAEAILHGNAERVLRKTFALRP